MKFQKLLKACSVVWVVSILTVPVCEASKQERERAFYFIDNLVTVNITMDPQQWNGLLADQPKGGVCNFNYDEEKEGPRYQWRTAQSMTISGTQAPTQTLTVSNIEIRKKSFCGSFSTTKPSLKIKMKGDASKAAKKAIGVDNLIFNNSQQDGDYIRQCSGYFINALAGLPHPLCNVAKVMVNGQPVGNSVFINLEAFKKPYVKRNFDGNTKGNLYELIAGQDLVPTTDTDFFGFKGYSSDSSRRDLERVIAVLAMGDIGALGQLVDLEQFTRFWAMEILQREGDGYTSNTNNTYVYNDLDLTIPINQQENRVNLKFAMWGNDQILKDSGLGIYHKGKVAAVLYNDPASLAKLKARLLSYAQDLFAQDSLKVKVFPYMDRLAAQFNTLQAGLVTPAAVSQIKSILSDTSAELNNLLNQ